MATFTVVGAGMMGSALTVPLADAGHEVRLVGTPLDEALIERLKQDGHHATLKETLPADVRPFAPSELVQALAGADAVGLGVSSQGVRWAARAVGPHLRAKHPVVMISKGLEWTGEKLAILPDVFTNELPDGIRDSIHPVAVAGPCIAGELARRVETCVVFAGRDPETVDQISRWMSTPYYNIRAAQDVVGAEVAAALKNAYALAVALADGIHEQRGGVAGSVALHNYESAVFAQSIVEMQRVIGALGGSPLTAAGLAGVGDLDVTCNGGRTGRFGRWLGKGLSTRDAIEKMAGATLECIDILRMFDRALPKLEQQGKLRRESVPLLSHLIAIVIEGAPVSMPFSQFFRD